MPFIPAIALVGDPTPQHWSLAFVDGKLLLPDAEESALFPIGPPGWLAYAEVHDRIGPVIAARAVARASATWSVPFSMVQADNGPEFSRCFEQKLARQNILVRHSRLGRPNDNAHIERFNRTIQEECLGNRLTYKTANKTVQVRLAAYLDYYNYERVHLGIQLRTPSEMLQRS